MVTVAIPAVRVLMVVLLEREKCRRSVETVFDTMFRRKSFSRRPLRIPRGEVSNVDGGSCFRPVVGAALPSPVQKLLPPSTFDTSLFDFHKLLHTKLLRQKIVSKTTSTLRRHFSSAGRRRTRRPCGRSRSPETRSGRSRAPQVRP